MIIYAGIGSRETPSDILKKMTSLAKEKSKLGWTLRSGGALGADLAFEAGANKKEIYLAKHCTLDALELSSKYHPAWDRCSGYAKKLHGRNAMIILGKNLDSPVDYVYCWTKDGKATGGTGQGLRIANAYDIPIINLYFGDNS